MFVCFLVNFPKLEILLHFFCCLNEFRVNFVKPCFLGVGIIGVHRIFLRGEMRRTPQNLFNSWPQNNALLHHLQAKFIFWGGRSGPPKSLRGEIISLFSPPLCTPMYLFLPVVFERLKPSLLFLALLCKCNFAKI